MSVHSRKNNNYNKDKRKNGRLCHECESGYLIVSTERTIKNGITYSNKIIFCPECGYRYNEKSKRKHRKEDEHTQDSFDFDYLIPSKEIKYANR